MNIKVQPIKSLSDVELDIKGPKYPQSSDENLPKLFWVGAWIGGRNSGKTHSVTELLKLYEAKGIYKNGKELSQRVIIFSPTYDANKHFWKNLSHHDDEKDVYTSYSDAILKSVMDDIVDEEKATLEYHRLIKIYKKCVKSKDGKDLTEEDVETMEKLDWEEPNKPRYINGCVNFLIFDDLVGSKLYKSVGESFFTTTVLKNRHVKVNILMLAQSMKKIPKAIRENVSLYVLFKFANAKLINVDLYPEVSNTLTLDQFENLYKFATAQKHGSLVVDLTRSDEKQFKLGWRNLLAF
jgi:hypothetical protein